MVKKVRSSIAPSPSAPQTDGSTNANALVDHQFLSAYDRENPIVILLSALRKTQSQIWVNNFSRAGACVATSLEDIEKSREDIPSQILVVTDNLERTRLKLPTHIQNKRKRGHEQIIQLTYVSTKWVSAVLSAKAPVDPEPFLLQPASSPGEPLCLRSNKHTHNESLRTTERSRKSKAVLLPVWCKQTIGSTVLDESSDLGVKRLFLRMLPLSQCERATYSAVIYTPPNAELCDLLRDVARKRELEGASTDPHDADIRARAYRRASIALRSVPFRLSSAEEAEALGTFGPRVVQAVSEYIQAGSIAEAEELKRDKRLIGLQALTGMYGVGIKTATHMYDIDGIHDIESLQIYSRSHGEKMRDDLKLFLKWEHRMNVNVSYHTAWAFREAVLRIIRKRVSRKVRMVICGGLRRGEAAGHDIDLVYCRTDNKTKSMMGAVQHELEQAGLLVCVLKQTSDVNGRGETSYVRGKRVERAGGDYAFGHDILHGIAKWKDFVFRVDLVGVRDSREMAFATLAWSGSTMFQRDLRIVAEKYGWVFSSHGLFSRRTGKRVEELKYIRSEMDVFAALALTYRPPFERGG